MKKRCRKMRVKSRSYSVDAKDPRNYFFIKEECVVLSLEHFILPMIAIFFIVLISIQYSINKILMVLKEIKEILHRSNRD